MLKKITYFAAWIVILFMSFFFCLLLGLWQEWSTLGILTFWLLLLFLSAISGYTIRNIMINHDRKKRFSWFSKYRLSNRERVLRYHWNKGADAIRKMKHKKFSWYLMIGDRCGKSTLLDAAGVPYFSLDEQISLDHKNRIMNWWFFRNICILDISSRFFRDTKSSHCDWKKVSYRSTRLPAPAGIVISLPVTDILGNDHNAVHSTARRMRTVIESMIKCYGKPLPIHLMITKCDLFPGFDVWQQQLSPEQRQQVLGYTWPKAIQIDELQENSLHPLFEILKKGLSEIRISMGCPQQLSQSDYVMLLDFPEAFSQLQPRLHTFVSVLCEPNILYGQLKLQSVWFSSSGIENNTWRSNFTHDLLKQHLFHLGQINNRQNHFIAPWKRISFLIIFSIFAIWLVISTGFSLRILKPDITRLSPDALISLIEQNEKFLFNKLLYLPYAPLLDKQQSRIESLAKINVSQPKSLQLTFDTFRQKAISATPDIQRKYILQLANSILLWKQMQHGSPLNVLIQHPSVPDSLLQRTYSLTLSDTTKLALERYYIRQPEGKIWIMEAQKLLVNLVTRDNSLSWLTAPGAELPLLKSSDFWPTLSDQVTLSGAWTQSGERTLREWMQVIEKAAEQTLPEFYTIREQWLTTRQNAWIQYIADIKDSLSNRNPTLMTNSELIEMSQNSSPTTSFLSLINDELSNIPREQAQPWLITLRQLQQLFTTDRISGMYNRLTDLNYHLRYSFIQWLKEGKKTLPTSAIQQTKQTWTHWEETRNRLINEIISQEKRSDYFTRVFLNDASKNAEPSALNELLPALTHLQESISPQSNDTGTRIIWLLYKEDLSRLFSHMLTQSSCWINEKWRNSVLWPLEQSVDHLSFEEQQLLTYHNVNNFIHGPISSLLSKGKTGYEAAEYAGMKVPLTDEFLQIVSNIAIPDTMLDFPLRASTRENEQRSFLNTKLSEIEKQKENLNEEKVKITITSLPAVIPDQTTILPIGTTLSLYCKNGIQQLDDMNFAETREFSWQPGQCEEVSLKVKFPNFSVSYLIKGEEAWPLFIKKMSTGEMTIDSKDFSENASLLKQFGINTIIIRFSISDTQLLNDIWLKWMRNSESINLINNKIATLEDSIASRKENNIWSINISELPVKIANCK